MRATDADRDRPAPPEGGSLVIGECVADIVRDGAGGERVHPGGSPANVAYGLARLGLPAVLLTRLGADAHGRLIRAHLEAAGAEVLAEPVDRTPSAVVALDDRGRARYTFDIAWTLGARELGFTPGHVHLGSIAAVTGPVTGPATASPAGAVTPAG